MHDDTKWDEIMDQVMAGLIAVVCGLLAVFLILVTVCMIVSAITNT